MSGWTSIHDLLTEVSEAEVLELDRYVGDAATGGLKRSEKAVYRSGDWLAPGQYAVSKRVSGRHQGDR